MLRTNTSSIHRSSQLHTSLEWDRTWIVYIVCVRCRSGFQRLCVLVGGGCTQYAYLL
jgi:hypothetical protein